MNYDIAIVGGGMVGASLACALAPSGYRIALLEAKPLGEPGQPSYDERTIALAYGSKRILSGLGLWPALEALATPIKAVHVSERGRFGATRLDCREQDVDALGFVVANRDLGHCLYPALSDQDNLTLIAPAQVKGLTMEQAGVEMHIQAREAPSSVLRARLIVAADGSSSTVRRLAGFDVESQPYGQTAVVCNVTPQMPHRFTAYERFTASGPLAFLPMSEARCAVVWTHEDEAVDELMALTDRDFLVRLQATFGYRLGRLVKVGARRAYPLALLRANEVVRARIVLLGNAAHTLHPVAGQGFNLALRGVASLAELLTSRAIGNGDPGDAQLLNQFARWRADDLKKTVWFTDSLARVFTNPLIPLGYLRSLGLLALDVLPPLRSTLARRSMGMAGRLPRLATGLALERSG